VSAREDLFAELVNGELNYYEDRSHLSPTRVDIEKNADELIDAFAHELAEEIRAAFGDDAADLIDPEVWK